MPRIDLRPLLGLLLSAGLVGAEELQARLIDVDGPNVRLDKGASDGVGAGQIFDVYKDREVYYLPLTANTVPLVRPQRLVARVRVIHAEANSSRGTVFDQQAPLEKDLPAFLNTKAIAPNMKPTFLVKPTLAPVPWRARVSIAWKVENDAGEPIMFTWSATGGVLQEERTLECTNTWTAPPVPGEYTITVEATDAAGNVAPETLTAVSTGMPESFPLREFRPRNRMGAASRYGLVRDVAFDRLGRRFVLEQGAGGLLSSGRWSVRVDLPPEGLERIPAGDRRLSVIAVTNPRQAGTRWVPGALYALDADRHTVLRFGFGPPWRQVMDKEPMVLGVEGGSGNGRFVDPIDLATSPEGDRVYVLDAGQRCVQVFGLDGAFQVSFGRPGEAPLTLKRPRALAVGPRGTVYVLDAERRVVVAYRDFAPVSEFEVGGPDDDPVGLAVDAFDGALYVLDRATGWIKRFVDGRLQPPHYLPQPGELGRLTRPARLRMDPTRVLWVVDMDGGSLVKVDARTMALLGRTGGVELKGPLRVAGHPSGGVVALDTANGRVTSFDRRGWVVARFGGEGEGPGQFGEAVDLAVGLTGNTYVLDAGRQQVQSFSPQGRFILSLGRPGEGPRELRGAVDLSMTPDRRYVVVLQQRETDNFHLINPIGGDTLLTFGKDYAEIGPLGCVNGRAEGGRNASLRFWTVDDGLDQVASANLDDIPAVQQLVFDAISDVEANVAGFLFVCDRGEDRVQALRPDGTPAVTLRHDSISDPRDLGTDDYGRVYVYDHSSREVVEFSE